MNQLGATEGMLMSQRGPWLVGTVARRVPATREKNHGLGSEARKDCPENLEGDVARDSDVGGCVFRVQPTGNQPDRGLERALKEALG